MLFFILNYMIKMNNFVEMKRCFQLSGNLIIKIKNNQNYVFRNCRRNGSRGGY